MYLYIITFRNDNVWLRHGTVSQAMPLLFPKHLGSSEGGVAFAVQPGCHARELS